MAGTEWVIEHISFHARVRHCVGACAQGTVADAVAVAQATVAAAATADQLLDVHRAPFLRPTSLFRLDACLVLNVTQSLLPEPSGPAAQAGLDEDTCV